LLIIADDIFGYEFGMFSFENRLRTQFPTIVPFF